ncbi:MAG: MMPL family transporter [Alphaproteobacteria bacterium]|nr:MMPL family transporter [Alphaproteobacteria bacterium]
MVKFFEALVFRIRVLILVGLGILTVWAAYQATGLRMDAGFYKQLPQGHEYVQTFFDYQDRLFGANRIIIVLRQKEGDIWNQQFLSTLKQVSDDIFFLPGVDRRTVTSLWTPNTRILEITEDGITARDVVPGRITPATMMGEAIDQLRNDVIKGGFVGRLVSNDFTASLIVAELLELDPRTGERLDYFDLGEKLERNIRDKFETEGGPYEVHVVGFAKMITDIAQGGRDSVPIFFGLAFILTCFSVYLYSQSWILVFLAVSCSLVSVVWQFGLLVFLGFGLDPLAILVPFLVFAIGVSHGVQQLNLLSREIINGATSEQAARAAFSGLLVPGMAALITDLVGFATLYWIPIQMIQELAITASIGVGLKIVTNLVMLPILASYFQFDESYRLRVERARNARAAVMNVLGQVANPPVAFVFFIGSFVLFGAAYYNSLDRHVGDLHPGAPELLPDARYNYDSRIVADKFSIGLDLLTIVNETPPQSCVTYEHMKYLNDFTWYLENVPGVRSVDSAAYMAKQINAGWNEGNLKFRALPRNSEALSQAIGPIPTSSGLLDYNCEMLPIQVFTNDSKAETIKSVIAAIKQWRIERGIPPVLGQSGSPKLGLGDAESDLTWVARDDRQGTWTLQPGDISRLTFTPPPLAEGSYDLVVTGIKRDEQGNDTELFTGNVPVEVGEVGVPQKLDLRAAMPDARFADATEIKVSGVPAGFYTRLASGNVGVTAAVNEEIEATEFPMMLAVYAVIIFLVFTTYWDWRATLCCTIPLTIATFIGYWFMKELEIGLKVSTLPVMVLAVGIGVDYAFYIYNRVQYHLSEGEDITASYKHAMLETGMAVVFTAITFAIGVSTWSFSPLKFQADMGMLLTFMFLANMMMAITILPGWAVTLDTLIPRRNKVRAPSGEGAQAMH